jgi:hypothetical protein
MRSSHMNKIVYFPLPNGTHVVQRNTSEAPSGSHQISYSLDVQSIVWTVKSEMCWHTNKRSSEYFGRSILVPGAGDIS